jgi:hypothetical protein
MTYHDEKGIARCSKCGTAMTKVTREYRNPKCCYECPNQECENIETIYSREDEGEA